MFHIHTCTGCANGRIQTGEDVKNDQFDAAYDLSSADEGEGVKGLLHFWFITPLYFAGREAISSTTFHHHESPGKTGEHLRKQKRTSPLYSGS